MSTHDSAPEGIDYEALAKAAMRAYWTLAESNAWEDAAHAVVAALADQGMVIIPGEDLSAATELVPALHRCVEITSQRGLHPFVVDTLYRLEERLGWLAALTAAPRGAP